jgi:hypothetical protein
MPQFDTFCFFSQLFWVFFGFISLYLLFCYYLLPALATILKVRKRKLNQITNNSESVGLVMDSQNKIIINDNVLLLINNWNLGVANKLSLNSNLNHVSLNSNLAMSVVKFELISKYNFSLLSQIINKSLFWH